MALLQRRDPRPMVEAIDPVHQAIHERGMYVVSKTFLGVANNGFADIHIIPPAGYEAHIRFAVITEGKCYLKTYTGSTYVGAGTAMTPFNRATNGDATTALVYHTPTTPTTGTLRGDEMINGGTGGNAQGGASSSELETVLAPETDLLVRVQNVAGSAKDICIVANYYLRKTT